MRLAALVPRRTTRIVLCDDDDGLAARGAAKLAAFGYGDVATLAGGVASWTAAGFELFSGVNVPSKAFGEYVEHRCGTPHIAAEALHRMIEERGDVVVLDSRPFDEFQRVSIPTGVDVPGAELVLRVRDLAPDPKTLIVVNCAGRTRSIIGAQSLINAGVPNRVMALKNGTMGWSLAGFTPDHGKDRRAAPPSAPGLAWARAAAAKVAERFGAERIDEAALARFRGDAARTTYLFDVRDPGEYAAGHLPGAISAPGGQLVQATDQYVGTLGARLVLVDPLEVRAFDDRVVAEADGLEGRLRPRRGGKRDRVAEAGRARRPGAARAGGRCGASLPRCWRAARRPSSISPRAACFARVISRARGSPFAPGSSARSRA